MAHEIEGSFGSESSTKSGWSFLTVRVGAWGRERFPAYRREEGGWSSESWVPRLLGCPGPPSPPTDLLWGFYLSWGCLNPKSVVNVKASKVVEK